MGRTYSVPPRVGPCYRQHARCPTTPPRVTMPRRIAAPHHARVLMPHPPPARPPRASRDPSSNGHAPRASGAGGPPAHLGDRLLADGGRRKAWRGIVVALVERLFALLIECRAIVREPEAALHFIGKAPKPRCWQKVLRPKSETTRSGRRRSIGRAGNARHSGPRQIQPLADLHNDRLRQRPPACAQPVSPTTTISSPARSYSAPSITA